MNRRGKVFSLGLLVLYVIAAAAALIYVQSGILSKLPKQGIGTYQEGLLAARDRAEARTYYLGTSAQQGLDAALRLLYADEQSFFTATDGDGAEGLGCGTYLYALWNTAGKTCLAGDAARSRVLDALGRNVIATVAERALAYPPGGFTVGYDAESALGAERVMTTLHGAKLEEPILLGLAPGADAKTIADAYSGAQATGTLSWPGSSERITSCFGPRDLSYGAGKSHNGVDIGGSFEVRAAMDGTVIGLDPHASSVGAVWIQHSPELSTRYLHLTDIPAGIVPGATVKRGDLLGRASHVGCWKDAAKTAPCGDHLHFEALVSHAPAGGYVAQQDATPGWFAINPLCLFPADLRDKLKSAYDTTDDACRREGSDAPLAWCDAYGLTLTPATSPTSQPASATRPSQGAPTLPPDAPPKASTQQLLRTWQNRQEWDGTLVKASTDTGVPQALLLGIITQESGGDALAVSSTGCAGVAQWCIDNAVTANSTAAKYFGAGAYLTRCRCASTRATPGSGCACTAENDRRLRPAYAIPAQAALVRDLLATFERYTDRMRFAVAAYNAGDPVILRAVRATGDDPSWEEVAAYLQKHPGLVTYFSDAAQQRAKVTEITEYVPLVMAYTTAWNGGTPLDAGRAGLLAAAKSVSGTAVPVGTYSFDSSVTAVAPDAVSPFLGLVAWADGARARCKDADDPGACLLDAASQASPHVTQECEQDHGVAYFAALYEALRDCARNLQYGCQCALPAPPAVTGTYTFLLDQQTGAAALTTPDGPAAGIAFENITASTFRVGDIAPAAVKIILDGGRATLSYQETGDDAWQSYAPGWDAEKGARFADQLVFHRSATGAELCAPVKRAYAFCSAVAQGMPAAKFAVTLEDNTEPAPVTGLAYDASAKTVSFAPSSSKDVSFYDVYDAAPTKDSVPALQLRDGKTSFGASPYAGTTLYVTAVDQDGNEGAAASVAVS